MLAGCQTAQPSPPVPTATPRPALQRITLENASRIQQVSKLDLSRGSVRGVAWSPDSRLLAVAPYNQVQVWEIATMKRLTTLQGHQYAINGLAWSPDGRLLDRCWPQRAMTAQYSYGIKQIQTTVSCKDTPRLCGVLPGPAMVCSSLPAAMMERFVCGE